MRQSKKASSKLWNHDPRCQILPTVKNADGVYEFKSAVKPEVLEYIKSKSVDFSGLPELIKELNKIYGK